jgi:hypothetical protein
VDRPKAARADVHVIGELVGASDFPSRYTALSCRYRLVCDAARAPSWAVVRGLEAGSTHVASVPRHMAVPGEEPLAVWEHPLDMQLSARKLEVRSWSSTVTRSANFCSAQT